MKASNNVNLVKCLDAAKRFRKINGHIGKETAGVKNALTTRSNYYFLGDFYFSALRINHAGY